MDEGTPFTSANSTRVTCRTELREPHIPMMEEIAERLNTNLIEVLRKAEEQCEVHLETGNYEDIVGTMNELKSSQGTDEQAQYRHLQQVIRNKLSKDIRRYRNYLPRLGASIELKDAQELSTGSSLVDLENCSDFVDHIKPLASVVEMGVQELETLLNKTILTVFDTLHKRLKNSLQWKRYLEAEQLYRVLSGCNIWHRLDEEKRKAFQQCKTDIDDVADAIAAEVDASLEAQDGRQLAKLSAALARADADGAFSTRINFKQVAENAEEIIRHWLQVKVSALEKQINRDLTEAKKTMEAINSVATPLQEKRQPPFEHGTGSIPEGGPGAGIAAQVLRVQRQYTEQVRYRSIPKITPESVDAVAKGLCEVEHVEALYRLIESTEESIESAMKEIEQAQVDDMAAVSLPDALVRFNGLHRLNQLLQDEASNGGAGVYSFKKMVDALQLDEKIKTAAKHLLPLIHSAMEEIRELS